MLLARGVEHPHPCHGASPREPCTPPVAVAACKQPSGLPETATCISLAMLKHHSTAMWQLAALNVAVAGWLLLSGGLDGPHRLP